MPSSDKEDIGESAIRPFVFISHDTRDSELAEAFSKLLSSVSAGVLKSFRSSDRKGSQGIEFGAEWYHAIMSKLNSASDVVCLLTARSLDRPWLLYEAGVAKGKLDTTVFGIALGIPLSRANTGPFAQFQNCDDSEESLTKLVVQLAKKIPGAEPDNDDVQAPVQKFKATITKVLKSLEGEEDQENIPIVDETSVAKLFEEVKAMFQDLPSRLESKRGTSIELARRRTRLLHPEIIEDMVHSVPDKQSYSLGILMISCLMKNDFPWLYELGIEAYQKIQSGNRKSAEEALFFFSRIFESTIHRRFKVEMGLSKESFAELQEIYSYLEYLIRNYLRSREKGSTKSKRISSVNKKP